MKNAEGKPVVDTKRPYLATECDNVKDANRFVSYLLSKYDFKIYNG